MKYVFIGDIHGKLDAVKAALDEDGHKVFVGDFADSYEYEDEEHEKCLLLAMDAAEAGDATLLYGNHELSYLNSKIHGCSGYRPSFKAFMDAFADRISKFFVSCYEPAPGWLVTHAGLHPLVQKALGKDIFDVTPEELQDPNCPLNWIGRARGGKHKVGGIFWCDYQREFEPIDGLNQIFGHSRQRDGIQILKRENTINYCIDCLDFHKHSFLKLDL